MITFDFILRYELHPRPRCEIYVERCWPVAFALLDGWLITLLIAIYLFTVYLTPRCPVASLRFPLWLDTLCCDLLPIPGYIYATLRLICYYTAPHVGDLLPDLLPGIPTTVYLPGFTFYGAFAGAVVPGWWSLLVG